MKSSPTTQVIVRAIGALAYEKLGLLEHRNRIASEIFANRRYRNIRISETTSVETWWDRYSQNYVTQLKDAAGNQIGEASYTGNAGCAAVAHLWALGKAINS